MKSANYNMTPIKFRISNSDNVSPQKITPTLYILFPFHESTIRKNLPGNNKIISFIEVINHVIY